MAEKVILIFGFVLVVCSIVLSVFFGFYYWYSFYVIGAFIFFGTLNYQNKTKTVFTLLFERKIKKFLLIYLMGLIFGFLVDIIYGRTIASLWHYPHLSGSMMLLIPVFIYYPFGGLQVYEIFYFLKYKLSNKFKNKSYYKLPIAVKNFISSLLILFLIVGVLLPIFNLFLNENRYANELIVTFMILTTFSIDMIIYKLDKNSIFLSLLEGNKLVIMTLLLSWGLSTLLTEYPNTYSWEWIYTMPFTNFEIFKINILVLTFGWFFLVYVPVRYIDLIFYFLRKMNNGVVV